MSWWAVLPGLVGLAALWVLPGYAVLRLLGVRGALAWGGGAAVTSALAGVLAIALDLVGVRWSLWSFLVCCLGVVLVAAALGRALGTTGHPTGVTVAGETPMRHTERAWLATTWAIGGGVLAVAMMVGMRHADQPAQAWDAIYHVNALWFIRETGNASSLGGLAPMYADTAAPYYPTVWHSIVAIAPGFPGVTEAANASSIVLGVVVWIAGLVALARVVWPGRALPVILVPVLAASYVTFPAIAVSMLGVWPFALSTACLPGTLALVVATLRGVLGWRMHLAHGLGLALAAAGVVLAHGSGLFSLVLLAAPLLAVLLARQLRRFWRRGHRVFVAGVSTVLVVGAAATFAFLLTFPPVEAILDYQRGGQDSYWPGIGALLIDHPLIYVYDITSVNLAVTALVVTGAVLTIRRKHARWLIVALLVTAALTLLAAGPPDNPLRVLAGFWYTQASRLNQLLLIPAIMLAAGGGAWAAHRLADAVGVRIRWAGIAVVVAVIALTSGLRWSTQTEVMASTYSSWPIAWGTVLEEEEIAMVDRAAQTLPDDAVVLGEPVAGSPLLLARSDVQVVYPQLTLIAGSPERMLLARRFDDWWRDDEVCAAVRELGVTHVYADDLTFAEGGKWEESTPGLRYISTSRPGFEKVDEGGHASLWKFTGCNQ